ncbi:hypothetical protein [Bradyrhizobium sp. LA7.1]|uniref:hypothetical protein n=1 Tax=Bradyrhizobium sp. LA7.1 TaxID=3156324 RepID=UPI00339A9BFF
MPAPTQEKKPPKTAAERQEKYRKSLMDKGLERVTLTVESSVAQCMRDLSRDHNVPQAAVFKLGTLIAKRELQAMVERQALKAK